MSTLELKEMLANAIKMLELANHIDFNGHASMRLPESNTLLINNRKASRSLLSAEDIIEIDLDGQVIDGGGEPPNEYPLHTQIYKHREDVQAVIHTHPQWSTLFTIAQVPLRPVVIQGAVLGEIPVFPKSHSISNTQIADELASMLEDKNAILMKAHGAALVGNNIMEAFVRSVFLEENAYRQYMASQLGYAHSLSEEEIIEAPKFLWKRKNIEKVWANHLSKL